MVVLIWQDPSLLLSLSADVRSADDVIAYAGYEWWLFQDYWLGNNGIVDTFMRPKPGVAPYIKAFNAPSIFVQEGIELAYSSKDALAVDVSLSNFGAGDLPIGAVVQWSLLANGVSFSSGKAATTAAIAQGMLGTVASVRTVVPDAGTTVTTTAGPIQITLLVKLISPAAFASAVPVNSWNSTVFPTWVDSPTGPGWNITVTDGAWLNGCMFNNCLQSPAVPDNSECTLKAGVGFPNEKSGGDVPCSSAHDCCSICKLDTACKAAAFDNSSDTGICHIKTSLDHPAGTPTPNSAAVTLEGRAKAWPASVYLTSFLDETMLETAAAGSVVLLLQDTAGATSTQSPRGSSRRGG